jgi:hypothetical protein
MRRSHKITLGAALVGQAAILAAWARAHRRRHHDDTAGVMIKDTEIFQPSEGAVDDFEHLEAPQAETPNIRP